jgi:hypothetical protein
LPNEGDLVVGDNEPYVVGDETDCDSRACRDARIDELKSAGT